MFLAKTRFNFVVYERYDHLPRASLSQLPLGLLQSGARSTFAGFLGEK